MEHFTGTEVLSAYKKLKHYFYYDNTALFIRNRIAEFEENLRERKKEDTSFEDHLSETFSKIGKDISNKSLNYWKNYFKQNIGVKVTPKTLQKVKTNILSNRNQEKEIVVDRINIFIDAPVEIHIISTLWLMYIGRYLNSWISKDNYAYLLELTDKKEDEQTVVNGLRLYKPYFNQYQNWRDNAIQKVEQLFDEKKDCVLLSLDIKDYFHNAIVNLKQIKLELFAEKPSLNGDEKVDKLFTLLHLINKRYSEVLSKIRIVPELKPEETILPIGLLSSGILGNIVLRDFDSQIKETLNPSYYGRYVDDILLVMTNVQVRQNCISPANHFLNNYFVERKILQFSSDPNKVFDDETENSKLQKKVRTKTKIVDSKWKYHEPEIDQFSEEQFLISSIRANSVSYQLAKYPTLRIQTKKVILQDFASKESPAIINKFKKNLEKNRSEFRFLPDEEKVESEFDEEAFALHYSDSVNKIRSIKEFSEDKYGASKYLASKIFLASFTDEKPDAKTLNQILTFFRGSQGIAFHSLWEKVATYFIVTEQKSCLLKFIQQCITSINHLKKSSQSKSDTYSTGVQRLQKDLLKYLDLAIASSLAYNPSLLSIKDLKQERFNRIIPKAMRIRRSNLFRHLFIEVPVINYSNYLLAENGKLNLLKIYKRFSSPKGIESIKLDGSGKLPLIYTDLEINQELLLLSPRYVHYHETFIFSLFKETNLIKETSIEALDKINQLPDIAFDLYWRLNKKWSNPNFSKEAISEEIESKKAGYYKLSLVRDEKSKVQADHISVFSSSKKKGNNLSIALANIKVDSKDIEGSYLGKANTSKKRRTTLFSLFNLVEEAKAELFVLPEVSVPYKWLTLLASQAHKRNIGIISGLEHWVNVNGIAFNFIATILPIQKEHFRTCLIKVRVKNHYSPEETRLLKGHRLFIPSQIFPKGINHYDLFHWRNTYFSVYNCFELADISDRAIFKSKVDFIVASEYNRDTNYFSEIAGSWVRDIHCHFVQVNTSDYGDSRLIQPSETAKRDIIKIKGGENSTILVGTLEIDKLRRFQLMEYDLQKDDKSYKPTPPDFDRRWVEFRINNESF